ncbi:hypothetical protein KXD40_006563 [Peronospora effusa]|uniref:Uncharacterized protein n=1 Tax=Peronospora effusa TaxID=542832 RepID=A0A3M6VP21_9STRA|nr:hypothetical protein DD238_006480 [Peronospora effusa]RQM18780.1 hypothetical protein DD237_008338 [Peronospora effusa]UIZ24770.1 hypothetical protein KXD40_006563 [Peronospora effusa]CAI5717423.1 unnamed protein product [Peronospora effusa]
MQRFVVLRTSELPPVRVFGSEHEDSGNRASHDRHEQEDHKHVSKNIACHSNYVTAYIGVLHVGVVHIQHTNVDGANDDIAQPEDVAREVVVHNGALSLNGNRANSSNT